MNFFSRSPEFKVNVIHLSFHLEKLTKSDIIIEFFAIFKSILSPIFYDCIEQNVLPTIKRTTAMALIIMKERIDYTKKNERNPIKIIQIIILSRL